MNFVNFFLLILSSLAIENPVFARALGINRWIYRQNSLKKVLIYGATFSWVLFFSTIINYFAIQLLADLSFAKYLRALVFLIVVFAVYILTFLGIKKALPTHLEALTKILPITTFNTALFGVFYTIFNRNYGLSESIAYAIGTGIGYTAAMIVLYYAKKRLRLSPIPVNFRGTPIILLYIGLLSLGLYGLLGYGVSA